MSGHNKWSSIKHKKGAADAKRGKLFSRLIKEITVAAKEGGGDINFNPRLRTCIETAKQANMPANNIANAVKRGTGDLPGVSYDEVVYEGYGPAGIAILIKTLTDNKNRTVAEIRHIFDKYGGSMGEAGCVSWMFDKKGVINVAKETMDEDTMMEKALEAGADDLNTDDDDVYEIYTDYTQLHIVSEALKADSIEVTKAEVTYIPQNYIKLEGKKVEQFLKLMDKFEDQEDVQLVVANADIDDAELEALSN